MDTQTSVSNLAQEVRIPFSQLRLSPRNVRKPGKVGKNDPQHMSLKSLAESILHLGVVQNLVVTKGEDQGYEVEAGGRRFKALELLAKAKKIEPSYEVRCLLVPQESAMSMSLTENVQREAMHPADEFAAFKALVDEGKSVDDVAAQFGTTPLVVQRRLKLATVSPRLLKAFRADEASLDQLMALAITDDHKLQEAVFLNAPTWQRGANQLRARLTEQDVEADRDPVARFVGIDAYREAGGTVRTDLFAEPGKGIFICDRELLDKLASDKLAAAVESVKAEGWSWTDAALRVASGEFYSWQRVQPGRRKATPAEAKALASLDKKLSTLRKQYGRDQDGDAEDAVAEQMEAVQAQVQQAQAALCVFGKKSLEVAGAVVYLDNSGQIAVQRGLVKPEDVKRLRAMEKEKAKAKKGGKQADEQDEAKPTMSEALTRRLTAHRTAALQAELVKAPDVALVVVVHKLALKVLGDGYGYRDLPARIDCTPQTSLDHLAPELPDTKAAKSLAEAREVWEKRLPKDKEGELDSDKLFAKLQGFKQSELLQLLALCAACSLDAVEGREGNDRARSLALALDLDMGKWWTATADSYFGHVSKARTLEHVGEFAADQVQPLSAMKKGELAAAAERLVAGRHWLPPVLRKPK